MAENIQNTAIDAGDDKNFAVTVKDSSDVVVNITGSTITYKVVRRRGGTALVSKSSTDTGEIVLTNSTGGVFTVTFVPADTNNLAPGFYYHEADAVIGGLRSTVFKGHLTIRTKSVST